MKAPRWSRRAWERGGMRAVPRLSILYPGICLTTEENHGKPQSGYPKGARLTLAWLTSQSTSSLWRWNWHRVPKRRPTTIWRRGNTQKNIYKEIDAFCHCANVPKNCYIQSAVKTSELNDVQFCSTHCLLQQTAFRCSLIIMEVPMKQFICSPPDFSTYLRHNLPV